MPPKKRDKESEISSKIIMGRDQAADNEMFLQAFEKPTQIYRYIANRHVTNPLYLNRTLTYMKHRMSRSHKKRDTFKIDNMLQLKQNKIRMDKASIFGDFITFKFLGFYDKNDEWKNNTDNNSTAPTNNDTNNDKIVRVETILLKISHKKRKDSSSDLVQDSMGAIDVRVNPCDTNDTEKCPTINIPTESFMPLSENQNKSFLIFFKVETIPKISNIITENCDEPTSKRQKPNTKFYGSEMIIFDKHSRCVLTVGEYDVALQEIIPSTKNSPKKLINWETIPMDSGIEDLIDQTDNPFDIFTKCPSLKFNLEWTNKSGEPVIDTLHNLKVDEQNNEQELLNQCIVNNNLIQNPINNENNVINIKNKKTDLDVLRNHNNNSIVVQSSSVRNCTIGKKNQEFQQQQLQQHKSMEEEKVKIVYNFMYNNNSRQQTEYSQLSICPWCRINCRKLYALLKHLKLCHPRFNFTYVPINDAARIDVTINDMYDGSYAGSPNDLVGPSGTSFARTCGRVRRTVVTNLLVCRPRRQKASLSEFLELDENEINNQRPYITGHNRLYHHTETCLPVHPKELDIDSEGESDPLWLQHKTMQMIDEFTDVNEGEKELMKMWNLHVMRHGYVGDCQLSIACDMFLEIRGRELIQKNLYRNFVLHMCSLFDYGLVSPETVQKTIQKLQGLLSTYQDGRKIISQSRESQLDYWLKFGIHKQALQDEQKLKSPTKIPNNSNNNNNDNNILINKSISSTSSSSTINNSIAIVALPKNTQLLKNNSNNNNNGETSKKFAALCVLNNTKTTTENNNKNKSLNDKLKETIITNKINNGNISNSISSTNVINRKRSMSTLQTDNSTIASGQLHSNKRRLSQLRDTSPPRRRSTPTTTATTTNNNNNKQKNQKNRRQSVAVFNTAQIAAVAASSNQIAMRKRLSIPLTKAEKH